MSVDPSAYVAPTARVHPDAVIGAGCYVGEYCVIEQDVKLGAECRLDPYVLIRRWTTLGDHNEVSAGTALGTDPLDKQFTGARSYLTLGNRNKIREHFTISRGTQPESGTRLGDDNYIMTSGHIAHNCTIGSNTVIASCALVAGYVEVGDGAFISGGVAVHQFSKIGRLAMIAGSTRVNCDVPPFLLCAGWVRGLNIVGLRRAGFAAAEVSQLKAAYRLLYRSKLKLADALGRMEQELPSAHVRHLVEFVRNSRRGICREEKVQASMREALEAGSQL